MISYKSKNITKIIIINKNKYMGFLININKYVNNAGFYFSFFYVI